MKQTLIHMLMIAFMTSTTTYCLDKKPWWQSLKEYTNKAKEKVASFWKNSDATLSSTYRDYPPETFGERLYLAEQRMGLRPKEILRTEEIPYIDPDYDRQLRQYKDIKAFEKVAEAYALPKHIIPEVEQGFHRGRAAYRTTGPSGVWYKGFDLDRIFNAERAKKVIKDNHLNLITIPQKYMYKTDVGWRVFAEPVKPGPNQGPLTLDEVKQLVTFMQKTGFSDFYPRNWIRTADGKIAIIDTEDRSFRWLTFAPSRKLRDSYNPFTDEAKKWLSSKEHKESEEKEIKEWHKKLPKETYLPTARQHDPKGLDFKRAYRANYVDPSYDWE